MRGHCHSIRFALFLGLGIQAGYAATSLGRSYSFGFGQGNLIRNWSFESQGDNWHDEPMVQARFRAAQDGLSAVTGTYVSKIEGTNSAGSTAEYLASDLFPIQENTTYSLSMNLNRVWASSGLAPKIRYYLNRSETGMDMSVGAYPSGSGWQSYGLTFTSPPRAAFARIILVTLAPGQGAKIYFDDIILGIGEVIAPKSDIQEGVTLFDGQGQSVQAFSKISGSGDDPANLKYLVQANAFDYAGRLDKSYATYVKQGAAGFDLGYAANALNYNNGSMGSIGKGSLDTRPYQDFEYWDEPGSPLHSQYMPGTDWAGRDIRSGWCFVPNLNPLDNPDQYNVENAEALYRMDWTKDVEGRFSLSWFDREGHLLKTGTKIGGVWKYTQYEYYQNGALKKVLTPLDVSGDEAHQEFREVTNYNSAGEVTSTYTKDRGLTKFWQNRLGQMRFSQHESQAPNGYTFTDYDIMGRPIASGVQTIDGFTASMAEDRSTYSPTKTEHLGIIYDNLGSFQARTGFTLVEIIPGKTVGANAEGRVACEFNFNKEVSLAGLTAKDKFVATFYNYDKKGRITEAFKYIGSIKTAAEKIHKAAYAYDDVNRIASISLYNDSPTPVRQSLKTLFYDSFSRVRKITGEGGKFISGYEYYDWGGAKAVLLGGDGSFSDGIRIEYAYHGQNWLKEIKATQQSTGQVVYQQMLGYEAKAVDHANVPALLQPKFDGAIAQQINKFTSDMEAVGPVRLTNYQYDEWGRMLTADARKNNAPTLSANQTINYSSLQWNDGEDMDSRMAYDDIGRIAANRSGVAAADQATYHYQSDSYRLDRVTGKLNPQSGRDASVAGTFVYDAKGRMIEDKSKKMYMRYGWNDMPVEFALDMGDSLVSDFNLYDASGNRVCRVQTKTSTMVWVPILLDGITFFVPAPKNQSDYESRVVSSISDVAVVQMGDRRWTETYSETGGVSQATGVAAIFGTNSVIGDVVDDGSAGIYRFFVKNHLGSTMLTVDDRGRYGDGRAMDYLAYGSHKDLKVNGADPVTQKFTGKESEHPIGLYHFGWRNYDPELGIWTRPDPANQYFNPYSYNGGDPVNLIDPNGLFASDEDTLELDPLTAKANKGKSYQGQADDMNDRDDRRRQRERDAQRCDDCPIIGPNGELLNEAAKKRFGTQEAARAFLGIKDPQQAAQEGTIASPGPNQIISPQHMTEPYYGPAVTDVSPAVGASMATPYGTFEREADGGWRQTQLASGAVESNPPDPATVLIAGALGSAIRLTAARGGLSALEASSALNRLSLGRQLASSGQMGERGLSIIGAGTSKVLNHAGRLAAEYGGSATGWAKMSSSTYRSLDGLRFETHWYQHVVTGMRVEYKTKILGY